MYCKKCGAEIKEGSAYCGKCGQSLKKKESKIPEWLQDMYILVGCIFFVVEVLYIIDVCLFVPIAENWLENRQKSVISQQVEEIFNLVDAGEDDLADEKMEALMEEEQYNPEFYLACGEESVDRGEIREALDILLIGYEATEDEKIMDYFVDTSLRNLVSKSGLEYDLVKKVAEELAKETDNESKLELAKEIYFAYQRMTY